MQNKKLESDFFSKDARTVAENLLGKILVRKINGKKLRARIVETEAYLDESDPGSRARQNGDLRETMMMAPGTILVYGVHNNWLLNFITGKEGEPEGVLIRAGEPLNFKSNCSGPGLLTKSMSIKKDLHKKSVTDGELWVEDDGVTDHEIVRSFRIGLSEDMIEKMRFYIKGSSFVSRK